MGINRGTVLDLINDVHRASGFKDYNSYSYLFNQVDMMPESVEKPEPHWIPVEQDTPTEDGDYWATFGAETGWFVDWCSWYHGRWVVWLDDIPNEVSNVIAWCKPMEPYKEVTECLD